MLGELHQSKGELEEAAVCFRQALKYASAKEERALANHRLGEIDVAQKHFEQAKEQFQAALLDDPELVIARQALQEVDSMNAGSK